MNTHTRTHTHLYTGPYYLLGTIGTVLIDYKAINKMTYESM